jgi:hypothetical protein
MRGAYASECDEKDEMVLRRECFSWHIMAELLSSEEKINIVVTYERGMRYIFTLFFIWYGFRLHENGFAYFVVRSSLVNLGRFLSTDKGKENLLEMPPFSPDVVFLCRVSFYSLFVLRESKRAL